jgi:hypothetical protein
MDYTERWERWFGKLSVDIRALLLSTELNDALCALSRLRLDGGVKLRFVFEGGIEEGLRKVVMGGVDGRCVILREGGANADVVVR